MSNRPKIPNPVRRRVLRFYGQQCVACNSPEGFDLAHIDDDRQNSVFENLIPLCRPNQTIQRSKDRGGEALAGEADPQFLYDKGHYHFGLGTFSSAYACHRLAAHLFENRLIDFARATDAMCAAIGSLRPLGQVELLRDAILRTHRLARNPEVPRIWKAEFLSQLGLVFYDFSLFKDSIQFQRRAWKLFERSKESAYPVSVELRKAAAARRAAISEGPRNDSTNDSLKSSTSVFEKHANYRGIGNNLQVQADLERMRDDTSPRVLDFVKEALTIERKIHNPWVVAELYYLQGLCYARRNRRLAIESLEEALGIFEKYKIIPEASPMNLPDLNKLLQSFGRPAVSITLTRKPLPFTQRELKNFYALE